MSKGILVLAQNNTEVDYVEQACLLAMSLKTTNPNTGISIVTNDFVPYEYENLFDEIIEIPWYDDAHDSNWKVENRWKLYHATPYTKTIVMDTDMLVLQDLTTWWDFLSNYDIYFPSSVYTYRGEKVNSDFYRKAFTANNLPNLYVGLHYFKKCDFAHEFYSWLELVSKNWKSFYDIFIKENTPKHQSMDVNVAIVASILDCENAVTNIKTTFPSFVHMKPMIQNWAQETLRWQDLVGVYINKNCELKIGNYIQNGVFHYTEKDFVSEAIIERYRNKLNV
jgi:hypothetical protein